VPHGELKIEVDVYRGKLAGLATAEVEFPSAAALRRFRPPPWFGQEVTGRKAFANSELARHGLKRIVRSGKSTKSAKSATSGK
jgi:CYTH domain-containing protein